MRRLPFLFLAAVSVLAPVARISSAATRPHYGGTLRVEISVAPASYDPAAEESTGPQSPGKDRIARLVFDRLTRLDDDGAPQPQLAVSWSHDDENKKWEFRLRAGVIFSDGTVLTAQDVVASLTAVNAGWRVKAQDESVSIESNTPLPGLPAELALARNSILRRGDDGTPIGTGPFRVTEWQSARSAVLAANDQYWSGRPFLDGIEITFARPLRDQLIDFELGKTDLIELGIDELRRARQENLHVAVSSPAELMAILFSPGKPENQTLRQALALSLDRSTIFSVLLQKQGEPAASLLPDYLSGYAFLFATARDVARAKQLVSSPTQSSAQSSAMTLEYDSSDTLARAIAERIALNAADARIILRVSGNDKTDFSSANADARLVRINLASLDARASLAALAGWLHEPVAQLRAESSSSDDFYDIEQSLLANFRVIPLFHLPKEFALSPRIEDWSMSPLGDWRLESVWLMADKP